MSMISSNTSSLKVGRSKVSICSTLFWKVQCYGTRCPTWKRETEKKIEVTCLQYYIPAYKTFWKDVNGWSLVVMAVRHVACLSWSPGIAVFTSLQILQPLRFASIPIWEDSTLWRFSRCLEDCLGKESRQWSVTSHPKGKNMYWFEWSNEIYEYPQKLAIISQSKWNKDAQSPSPPLRPLQIYSVLLTSSLVIWLVICIAWHYAPWTAIFARSWGPKQGCDRSQGLRNTVIEKCWSYINCDRIY